MIDLGTVRPGETFYVPFQTFDSNDPSASVAIAAFVLADIGIYKSGGTTERASTSGIVLLDTDGIDFDGIVGIGGFSVDLSDNATTDFYTNGDRFFITVGPVTVDAAIVNFVPATFRIGYDGAIWDTTISALTSQTSFTLAGGSADDDAYNDSTIIVHDIASRIQIAQGFVLDYTGSTKVVTLEADPGIFTMAVGDHVSVFPRSSEVGIAKAVWDRVLTGATHDIANSSGRRLRQAQEAGGYTLGTVYIDTVGGTAGTTDFENGVDSKQVDSIADANTIATSVGLSKFLVAPNSSITFAATQDGQVFFGALWTLALGGQSVNNTHIIGAEVTGICTGTPHLDHCHLGVSSFAAGEFSECGLEDTITLTGAADYSFINCYHEEEGAPSTIDFGSAVGTSEVHIHGWKGNLLIQNMDTGDILHFSSAEGRLEFDSSNTAGTKNLSGNFALVDNSTGMTLNDNGLSYDRMGAPAGASLAADLVVIDNFVDDLESRLGTPSDFGSGTSTIAGNLEDLADDGTATYSRATDSQQAIRDHIGDGTNLTEAGGTGDHLTAIPVTVDWANGGRLDLLLDAIKAITDQFVFTVANLVDSNMLAISGDTGAADALEAMMDGTLQITVNDASATTTDFATDGFTEATDDIFNGRLMTFLTGASQFEQTDVTDYDAAGGAQGSQQFTVTALVSAPANNVIAIIH